MDMYNNIYNPLQPNSMYPLTLQNNYQPVYQKTEVIKVNGRNGAEAMNLAPNSSILLLDINDPLVWFVSTDGAGYKTCIPYTITPYQPEQKADVETLLSNINKRLDTIEERMKNNESNCSNTKSVERTEWNI